ncbi:MAG: zinc ribbon domain-containing protein, partial [Myxococcales bacterium]|nr:zinc ribbon domain-containing protein [Myxococcales bacterium]
MRCSSCGHTNPPEGIYCQQCGVKLAASDTPPAASPGKKACPRCGGLNPTDMRFCTGCGYAYEKEAARPAASAKPAPKADAPSRLVAVMKDGSDGKHYALGSAQVDLGRAEGDVLLPDDPY